MRNFIIVFLIITGILSTCFAQDTKQPSGLKPKSEEAVIQSYLITAAPIGSSMVIFEDVGWVLEFRNKNIKSLEWTPESVFSLSIDKPTLQQVLNEIQRNTPDNQEWRVEKRNVRILMDCGWRKYLTFMSNKSTNFEILYPTDRK